MLSTTTTAPAQLSPNSTYTALLTELRIAALRALGETLATSDDPAEKRRAATAILRAPEPDEPQVLIRQLPERPPPQRYSDVSERQPLERYPGVPDPAFPQPQPHAPAPALASALAPTAQPLDPAELQRAAATQARHFLAHAGIPIDELDDLDDLHDLADLNPIDHAPPSTPAAHLIRAAGKAPSG
jgi:hypothetical protein